MLKKKMVIDAKIKTVCAKKMVIDAKIKTVCAKKDEFTKSILPSKLKSNYLTCSGCGSKIRKDLFNGFKCPACKTDFISPTSQKRLEAYDLKIKKLYDEKKHALNVSSKKNKSISKIDSNNIHMIDLKEQKLPVFKYINYFDTDAGFFSDDAYGIPLQFPYTTARISNYGFENGNYPFIIINHEEEVYGNDTHGWNAHYENGKGSYDFIASKEISVSITMDIVKKWINNNKEKIQNDLNIALKNL